MAKVSCFYTKLQSLRSIAQSFVEVYKKCNCRTETECRSYVASTIHTWCERRGFSLYTPEDSPIKVFENKELACYLIWNSLDNALQFKPGPLPHNRGIMDVDMNSLLNDYEWNTEYIREYLALLTQELKTKAFTLDLLDEILVENGFTRNMDANSMTVYANQLLHCCFVASHGTDTYYLVMSGPMEKYGRYYVPLCYQVAGI